MSFNNRFTLTTMPRAAVGEMLNEWRHRRNQSQLDLSVGVGVSARHLSFVETGRSRPSPELVLAIAEELRVPLRERNAMLLAAGYAPRYGQTDLDDESMRRIRSSLQMMLDRHNPYPGVVIDRQWNVMLANETARMLTQDLPAHVLEPRLNVFRICLHPDGLASHHQLRRLGFLSAGSDSTVHTAHRRRRPGSDTRRDLGISQPLRSVTTR